RRPQRADGRRAAPVRRPRRVALPADLRSAAQAGSSARDPDLRRRWAHLLPPPGPRRRGRLDRPGLRPGDRPGGQRCPGRRLARVAGQGAVGAVKVAVVGIGAMGGRIATRLLEGSNEVLVWNRSPARLAPLIERAAVAAATPAEA